MFDPFVFFPIALLIVYLVVCYAILLFTTKIILRFIPAIVTGIVVLLLCVFLFIYIGLKSYPYIEPSSLDALRSLPYLSWVPAGDVKKIGVTKYNSELAFQGFNLYIPRAGTEAYLMDMLGEIIHTWSFGGEELIYVEMSDNSDLLGVGNESLVKVDKESNIIWANKGRFHHDVAVAENDDIYTLTRADEIVFYRNLPLPILNDYILILYGDGKVKRRISLFKILKNEIPAGIFGKIYSWIARPDVLIEVLISRKNKHFAFDDSWPWCPVDIFHANTVEIINRNIDGFCKKGNLLICVRNLNLIGILDIEKEKLIWKWGQAHLDMPHHPTLLENGNILIFDNGCKRGYSRVVELDPIARKIVWEYKANPPGQFFSFSRGGNQRLPNQNTLITESDRARVFEITYDGQIVWEFYGAINEEGKRRAIYRMMRVTDNGKF